MLVANSVDNRFSFSNFMFWLLTAKFRLEWSEWITSVCVCVINEYRPNVKRSTRKVQCSQWSVSQCLVEMGVRAAGSGPARPRRPIPAGQLTGLDVKSSWAARLLGLFVPGCLGPTTRPDRQAARQPTCRLRQQKVFPGNLPATPKKIQEKTCKNVVLGSSMALSLAPVLAPLALSSFCSQWAEGVIRVC